LSLSRPDPVTPEDPNQPPEGVLISWTCHAPGGFSEADLSRFRRPLPALGLALKSASNRQIASDLLRVYLGREAGRRVLSGELQRGSTQNLEAVVFYFDLMGFTSLAERLPGADLIAMLNEYFGVAVAEIQTRGGHILKFMGDGLLAIFDQADSTEAADAALDCAAALSRRMAECNALRSARAAPATGFTIALHCGEMLFGNIGAENRLDFTVIGPAVNLTARLAEMHHAVGRDIILSDRVGEAATAGRHDIVSLGRYMLRGVSEPVTLYTVHQATTSNAQKLVTL